MKSFERLCLESRWWEKRKCICFGFRRRHLYPANPANWNVLLIFGRDFLLLTKDVNSPSSVRFEIRSRKTRCVWTKPSETNDLHERNIKLNCGWHWIIMIDIWCFDMQMIALNLLTDLFSCVFMAIGVTDRCDQHDLISVTNSYQMWQESKSAVKSFLPCKTLWKDSGATCDSLFLLLLPLTCSSHRVIFLLTTTIIIDNNHHHHWFLVYILQTRIATDR